MRARHLIAVTPNALAPFAATADQVQKYLEQPVGMTKSTLTVAEVRMQANTSRPGATHPVDRQTAEGSLLTRAEVQRQRVARTIERGGV